MKPLEMLKTPRECGLKLLEEASEACEEMKAVDEVDGVLFNRHRALMELCDVLQCVCNCLHTLGVTSEELDDAVMDVRLHNCNRGRAEVLDAPSFAFGLFGRRGGKDGEDSESKEDADD